MRIEPVKFNHMSVKDKIQLALLAVGVVILAAIIGLNFITGGKKTRRVATTGKKQETADEFREGAGTAPLRIRPKEKKSMPDDVARLASGAGRPDPFLRPEDKAVPLGFGGISDLKLSGIVSDGVKPLAIINGEMVAEGDVIGNKKIIKIKEKSVIVNEDGVETEITMGGFE